MSKKLTQKEYVNKMKIFHPNITVLGEYINSRTPVLLHCDICGNDWMARPDNSFYRNAGCKSCSMKGVNSISEEEYLKRLNKRNPNIILLETYKGTQQSTLFRCTTCGYEWKTEACHPIRDSGCPQCSGKAPITQDVFIQRVAINNPDIEVIGQYQSRHKHVLVKCKKCNHEWNSLPATLYKHTECPKCGQIKYRDTDDFVKEISKISPNIIILNKEDYKNTKSIMKCQCKKCRYIWETRAINLLQGGGCHCCTGRVCVSGINDIATTNPNLVKALKFPEDATKHLYNTQEKLWFKCPECGFERLIKPNAIHKQGDRYSCPVCNDGISYPNKFCRNVLKQLGIEFITEYSPEWIGRKKYDNYFEYNGVKYILEADGELHQKKKVYDKTHDEIHEIDRLKDKLAEEHGVIMIRIDCFYPTKEYISNQIINSKLNDIFDLSKIDWNECDIQSQKSIFKTVCDLYNELNNPLVMPVDISRKLKSISEQTVYQYLLKGTELGWCNYNSLNFTLKHIKTVYVYDNKNELIHTYKSIRECIEKTKELYNLKMTYATIRYSMEHNKFYNNLRFEIGNYTYSDNVI